MDINIVQPNEIIEDTKKEGFLSSFKWYERFFIYMFFGFLVIAIVVFTRGIIKESIRRERIMSGVKKKLRYFNPVISDGFFGKKITWIGRRNPLSDEELNKLCV